MNIDQIRELIEEYAAHRERLSSQDIAEEIYHGVSQEAVRTFADTITDLFKVKEQHIREIVESSGSL